QEGSQVRRWNGAGFDFYTFSEGAWTPFPPFLNVGESAFILVAPCCSNSCIRVQVASNIIVNASTIVPVNYDPMVADVCTNDLTVTCTPPPGTLFGLGTTPVHGAVTDSLGNQAACDFTVTIA